MELQARVADAQDRVQDYDSLRVLYLGWSGFASSHGPKSSPLQENGLSSSAQTSGVVELDAVYGTSLGLANGQTVRGDPVSSLHTCVLSNRNQAQFLVYDGAVGASTVHIEPLTESDWEGAKLVTYGSTLQMS